MHEILGWLSSGVLIATISTQLLKQWRAGTSKGVSKWLFVGQFVASTGFVIYSARLGNWVFVATNSVLGLEALLGFAIVLLHRRRDRSQRAAPRARDDRKSGAPSALRVTL